MVLSIVRNALSLLFDSSDDLPARFSWMCTEDVCTRLGISFHVPHNKSIALRIITPAGSDQGSCDCCWAFHIAQVLSDRIRIQQVLNANNSILIPQLSPMVLIRKSGRGCCSNTFEDGLRVAKENSMTTCADDAYSVKNTTCATYKPAFVTIRPGNIRYEIHFESTKELSSQSQFGVSVTQKRIKRRLFEEGPLLCRITLFPDLNELLNSKVRDPFRRTGGVYMRVANDDTSLYASFVQRGRKMTCNEGTCSLPGHGIALVGWDVTSYVDVPNYTSTVLDVLSFDAESKSGMWWRERLYDDHRRVSEEELRIMITNFRQAFPDEADIAERSIFKRDCRPYTNGQCSSGDRMQILVLLVTGFVWWSYRTHSVHRQTRFHMKPTHMPLVKANANNFLHDVLFIICQYLSWDEIGRLRRVNKSIYVSLSDCAITWRPLFNAMGEDFGDNKRCLSKVKRLNHFLRASRTCRVCASSTLQGAQCNASGVHMCTSCTYFFIGGYDSIPRPTGYFAKVRRGVLVRAIRSMGKERIIHFYRELHLLHPSQPVDGFWVHDVAHCLQTMGEVHLSRRFVPT
eukprot:6213706-Pleurochrysis_carterae.AAC.1